jgi:hypothetical protein
MSAIITRCFVKAAVPQEPLLGPIGQGVMAAVNLAGTLGPALGNSCLPSGSIKQTIEAARGAWASMAAHKLFKTSGRLAPLAIISSVRFSAATSDSACDRAVACGPCLDSDPAGLTTPAASLSCVFWSGLSRRSGEPITFSIWIPVYDPGHKHTGATEKRNLCLMIKLRF